MPGARPTRRLALGQILEYRADYERAIPLLEDAAREWDALGDPVRAAWAISFLGQAALDHEDAPRAEPSIRKRWAGSVRVESHGESPPGSTNSARSPPCGAT